MSNDTVNNTVDIIMNNTNSTNMTSIEPTQTEAEKFMENLIYGITAFIGLVAFVLLCVAIYLLCAHCHENKKVVVDGKEYYVRPPSITGSETSRDLIQQSKSRNSDMSDGKKMGNRV